MLVGPLLVVVLETGRVPDQRSKSQSEQDAHAEDQDVAGHLRKSAG